MLLSFFWGVAGVAAEFAGGGPKSGDVYKEFAFNHDSSNWRVTDPNADPVCDPGNCPSDFLPNPVLNLSIDDLQDAIKAEVPEEIQKALNVNGINLQQQLDQPFLLADSPGEVGAHFNRIAHLDTIDIGNQNIQKWIRSLEQDIRSGEQHLKELKEELGKYEHLDKFEQEVQLLETLDKQQESLYQKISKLKRLISDLTDTQEEINKKEPLLSIEPQIKELLKLYDEKRERQKEQDKLKNFVTIYEATTKKYRDKRRYLLEIEKKFHDVFPAVCPLCGQEVKDERNN